MFTGLVEEIGTVRGVRRSGAYQILEIEANKILAGTAAGDSISIDGACQTVTAMTNDSFSVETLAASLEKTTFASYRPGRKVNLERALTPDRRLGGHFVQGHVDGTGTVASVEEDGRNVYFAVRLTDELARYCVSEGSIAVDGVSLTISKIAENLVMINVIPTTWRETVLRERKVGDPVNIEVDIIGRYVARMLGLEGNPDKNGGPSTQGVTLEKLKAYGF